MEPTGQERLDRINRLVFNRHNINQLKQGICSLLDIFYDILEKDFEYGSYFTQEDISRRLEDVAISFWRDIREQYIDDKFHSYSNGNFTDDEMIDPAKLILDLINQVNLCREGLHQKIEQTHIDVMNAEKKVEEYREKANEAYECLLKERRTTTEKLMEAAKVQTKLKSLEALYNEKSEKLLELQRVSTVTMWEKEKEKLLKDSKIRIEELETEISHLRQSTKSISRRMSNIDDQNKLFKLKQEMTAASQGETGDVQSLKRDVYLRDRDIAHLEDEIHNHQKLYIGFVAGLRTDILALSERFYDEETSQRDPEFLKLSRTADRIYDAVAEGTLQQAKMMLPPHYTFHDKEVRLKRVRRLSKVNSYPKMSVPGLSAEPLPDIKPNGVFAGQDPPSETLPTLEDNPVIVDPKTNKMNGLVYLKHFPHMAQKFILDHWEKFKQYDKNKDLALDVSEVTELLQNLGLQFSLDQIEEAMDEVDVNHSHSIDFYEYLLVVEKVTRKSGKAKLFKQGLVKSNAEVSKACVIQ